MANLQSQIDILAKAVVNEHISITNAEGKIDNMEVYVNERIDGVEMSMNQEIDDMNERIDNVNGRIDDMNERIDGVEIGVNASVNLIEGYGGNGTNTFKTIDGQNTNIQGYKLNGLNIVYTTNEDANTPQQLKYNVENIGIFSHQDKDQPENGWAELNVYDPYNTLDVIGLNVEHIVGVTKTDGGIQEVITNDYFIDATGKISKIDKDNTKSDAITEVEKIIKHMSENKDKYGEVKTHVNKVKDSNGNNQEIYAVNFIGTTEDCRDNNVQIQIISPKTTEGTE